MSLPIDQQDFTEAVTFAAARQYLNKGKLIPSLRELGEDLAITALVNLGGPTVDANLDFIANLGPQANRIAKFILADALANMVMDGGVMASLRKTLKLSNLAAIGAGVFAGDMIARQLPEGSIPFLAPTPAAKAEKHQAARGQIAMANPLTAEGV